MITIKKFNTLKPETKLRKYIKIFHQIELEIIKQNYSHINNLKHFLNQLIIDQADSRIILLSQNILKTLEKSGSNPQHEAVTTIVIRELNSIRHLLIQKTGAGPADWDLDLRQTESQFLQNKQSKGKIFCDDIRSPFNLGSIIRTCEVFQIRDVYISPDSPSLEHPRLARSSMSCEKHLNIERIDFDSLYERPVSERGKLFALETNGTPIDKFVFPENGIAVLGSEELGVNPKILELAKEEGGIVSIPTFGNKASMNVGVAFGILASWWVLKKIKFQGIIKL